VDVRGGWGEEVRALVLGLERGVWRVLSILVHELEYGCKTAFRECLGVFGLAARSERTGPLPMNGNCIEYCLNKRYFDYN
jgi:hypothetical protein